MFNIIQNKIKTVLALSLLVNACTTTSHESGAEIRQVKLDQIDAGSSKAEVFNLLGSPSTKSMYGKENWYYITDKVKRRIVGHDIVLENSVIAISFTSDQKVDNVQIYGNDDKQDIAASERVTPTAGHAPSALEQILGNVGKFNGDSATRDAAGSRAPGGGSRPL